MLSDEIWDALDLLSLPEELGNLSSQLFELIHWNRHADLPVLFGEYLQLDFRPQHSVSVVRRKYYIYLPLTSYILQWLAHLGYLVV